MLHSFRTHDHPEANGRQPEPGDLKWTLSFPLENGDRLEVHCGRETHAFMRQFAFQEMKDDEMGLPPGVSTPLAPRGE